MIRSALLIASALSALACGSRDEPGTAQSPTDPATSADAGGSVDARPGRAVLKPTQGNTAAGELTLTSQGDGVHFTGRITGLRPASEHGIHVHERGDCSAPDASSAGEHFNPAAQQHGNPDSADHHAGDMYNIKADDQGTATVDTRAPGATLHDMSATDIFGKAVVLHEKADDYQTQPAGDSGDRIACGLIQ
ncbi:MAG: superoxide dismutase family protein [Rhodospirillaceae bacterium]|nr:superoxide dismutase family protein [Rhodospirillaceae bacterium]